jgi:hypothetical protein
MGLMHLLQVGLTHSQETSSSPLNTAVAKR